MLLLAAGLPSQAKAQSATFVLGARGTSDIAYHPDQQVPMPPPTYGSVAATSWNGTTCPGGPYRQDMGDVTFSSQATLSAIDILWQLGFPNNGVIGNCTASYGQPSGSWTSQGDTFTISGSAGCDYNVSFSFVQNYVVTKLSQSCSRGVCLNYIYYQSVSASGTVQVN